MFRFRSSRGHFATVRLGIDKVTGEKVSHTVHVVFHRVHTERLLIVYEKFAAHASSTRFEGGNQDNSKAGDDQTTGAACFYPAETNTLEKTKFPHHNNPQLRQDVVRDEIEILRYV